MLLSPPFPLIAFKSPIHLARILLADILAEPSQAKVDEEEFITSSLAHQAN
jgi:hypothetical protein